MLYSPHKERTMFWPFTAKEKNTDIQKVAKRELKENKKVLESLRDYDEGKKEIPTTNIKRRLSGVQTTS